MARLRVPPSEGGQGSDSPLKDARIGEFGNPIDREMVRSINETDCLTGKKVADNPETAEIIAMRHGGRACSGDRSSTDPRILQAKRNHGMRIRRCPQSNRSRTSTSK